MMYIHINKETAQSVSHQIYHGIKEAVLQGTLKSGEKLPSSRELAEFLKVARNAVVESYEQLIAEGYVFSKHGSGTFVSDGVQFHHNPQVITPEKKQKPELKKSIVTFRSGIPDLASIPIKKWAQIYQQTVLDIDPLLMDYQNPMGDFALRSQLAQYLNRARGAITSPENIMITNGAAQSFNLLCQLVSKNDYALVENPLSYGILHTLESNHVQMKPINLDAQGLLTNQLPNSPPKLIFTTPSHQFPTDVILPIRRRIELINYASKHDAYIVEDDYDSEFRFDGNPIQPMQFLDPQRVIYVGTFSKTLMPALRIGYMVLPTSLCVKMREAKFVSDIHSPLLEQRTLSHFIEDGLFERHIRKMRKLYYKKRNNLIGCLKNSFGEKVKISGAETGLHFIATFKDVIFDKGLLADIENRGVEIAALNKHFLSPSRENNNALIFGYGNTTLSDMENGISIIASEIDRRKLKSLQ